MNFIKVANMRWIYIFALKKAMPSFHALKVAQIKPSAKDAVVISFEVPEPLKDSFSYLPGQYISLETEIDGVSVRRSYSLCSSPEEDLLRVGVKKVKQGVFSSFVNESLKAGKTLDVSLPEGRFIYDSKKYGKPLLAVAAGSGITPIFSILKAFLKQNNPASFTLIYGNKSPEQAMFYKELKELETKYPEQLKIHWVFSQTSHNGALFGRITPSVINFVLNEEKTLPEHAFLCGPEPLILSTSEQLQRKGVVAENIHFELFTASSEQKEIENKITAGQLSITCDEVTHTIALAPDKTLLELALEARLEVPYSCQGGVCSSCIAKIKQGKATMLSNQILTDEEIEQGLILSCQAVAESEHIHLDYDDI